MTTIIIEDEKPAARLLQRKLQKLQIQVEVLLHSVEEAIAWFAHNPHPDLLFLDIQLSDGLSFEIFEKIEIKSAIIFTTAYDAFALRAFKLNSIDYLLKPIEEQELATAVLKFEQRLPQKDTLHLDFEAIQKMRHSLFQKEFKKRFTVKVGTALKIVSIEEVECFYSQNKATYLHTLDNRNYPLETTLEILEQELDPENFYRISRKFIIPIQSITKITQYSNSRLEIQLPSFKEDPVVVSREKVGAFRDWLR
ncbi:LytR/AlgR family response regulator transcription factor [Flavobacterium crassostreae]|uniref:DNA-binding response regulator n=1 Tax=Flavobacterium crassostreae TaxID=1763534 RepID=A0A1B9EA18_9FLAO|nr:LytTR family DNA-binding domain-containing protein [Flavobacterium crassostreae]OCB78797.1 DNA-binding response regulator [Flavobacterium crassostreae]